MQKRHCSTTLQYTVWHDNCRPDKHKAAARARETSRDWSVERSAYYCLASLLRVVVQTLVRLSERINGAYSGIQDTKMKLMRGTINQWRDKLTSTFFIAWRDAVRKTEERRANVIANLRYAPCCKCLHAMHEMISTKKAQLARAANMMRSGEARLQQMVMDKWRDSHFAERQERNSKLRVFFMDR